MLDVHQLQPADRKGNVAFDMVHTGANSVAFTVLSTISMTAKTTSIFSGWDDGYEQEDYEVGYCFGSDILIH